jgi:hypothetical protein
MELCGIFYTVNIFAGIVCDHRIIVLCIHMYRCFFSSVKKSFRTAKHLVSSGKMAVPNRTFLRLEPEKEKRSK